MTRQFTRLAILGAMALTAGCATGARYVTATSNTAVVAIPSKTNDWPHYYQKQAEDLMAAKFPEGYVVEYQDEFVPGANRHKHKTDDNSLSTGWFDQSEWRIYFRRKDAPEGAALALLPQPKTPGQPAPVQQAVSLTPTGAPIPNIQGVNMSNPGLSPNRQIVTPSGMPSPTGN